MVCLLHLLAALATLCLGASARIISETTSKVFFNAGGTDTRAAPVVGKIEVKFERDEYGEIDEGLCHAPSFDAIVTVANETYVFKGGEYWELKDSGIAAGYPRYISSDWPGLPTDLDAAVTLQDGSTYFFKDTRYWRFIGKTPDPGHPKSISEAFPGIPNNIGAAFLWTGNNRLYFMKGSQYWRFVPSDNPPVASSYPAGLSSWGNLPSNINDALDFEGHTYFFKDGQYWRYLDSEDTLDTDFPRRTGYWWFGCPATL